MFERARLGYKRHFTNQSIKILENQLYFNIKYHTGDQKIAKNETKIRLSLFLTQSKKLSSRKNNCHF